MTEPSTDLTRTPLEAEHLSLGAHMGAFAGWLMPITYRGTLAEHEAVREAVGLFDVSHLGRVVVEGPGAFDVLQRTLTNDLSRVGPGDAQYNLLLNDRAGIVDDLIAYGIAEDRYLVVPNAANTDAVIAALRAGAPESVAVTYREDIALIAPQGPRSFDLVGEAFPDAPDLGYMRCGEMAYRGRLMVVSRSGYTGERGFELFVPADMARELWRELLRIGESMAIQPCGLAARDTLRLEMGYPLHGNDIWDERTPLEAGLGWAVGKDKDFVGREALERQRAEGIPRRLWGLRMQDRLIPRPHYPVLDGQRRVGETTSGTFSPTLKVGIALAYLEPRDGFQPGDAVEVDVRGRTGTAEVVKPPFVPSSPK